MAQHDQTGGERETGLLSSIGRMFGSLFGSRQEQDEKFPDSPIFRMIGSEHEDDDPKEEVLSRVELDGGSEHDTPDRTTDVQSIVSEDESEMLGPFRAAPEDRERDDAEPQRVTPVAEPGPVAPPPVATDQIRDPGSVQGSMSRDNDQMITLLREIRDTLREGDRSVRLK